MTEPYFKAIPGDPILSENWNNMQVRMIEALRAHTHLGGDDGKKLGGGGIDPETTLTVKQVDVSTQLSVKGLNVFDRITGLGNEKLAVTGGTISGSLTVNTNAGIGTAAASTVRLDIKGATSDATTAALRVMNAAGSAVLEVRNDGVIGLYDKPIYLRGSGDTNHGIRFDSSVDGPRVFGNLGGQLVTTSGNKVALKWSGGDVSVLGDLKGEQDLWLGRNENNKKFVFHSRTGVNGDFLQITSDKADGSWDWANGIVLKRGGNIGIGTVSPQSALHVASASNVVARIEAGGTGGWAEVDLYSTYSVANLKKWNIAATGGGGFAIRQLTDARAELSVPLSINTSGTVAVKALQVQGAITPSVGNAPTAGIQFPSDPGGGGGDQAFLRYFVISGETTKLLLGIENDWDDALGLWQAGAERLSVYNGNVGIGTTTPQTPLHIKQRGGSSGIRLEDTDASRNFSIHYEAGNSTVIFYHQNGQGQFMRQDGIWQRNSDIALKENLVELEGALDKVLQLKPMSFDWKATRTRDIGFVAQDVEQLFPEIVGSVQLGQDKEPKTIKGIAYSTFGVLAIAALKELKAQYDEKLKTLEARLQALSTRDAR